MNHHIDLNHRRNRNRIAKTTVISIGTAILSLALLTGGCSKKNASTNWSLKRSAASAQLKSFVAEKEAQADAAARAEGTNMLPEYRTLFAAAAKGNWPTIHSTFHNLSLRAPQYEHRGPSDERLTGTQWAAVLEIYGAFEAFVPGDDKYCVAFGRDIIDSIPPGSIYFGGTEWGRFLVTAMCKSQVNADPFFVLTQNALADSTYLEYLRGMYGTKIYTPTDEDSKKCFQDYTEDAQRRMQSHQLMPGENVKMVDGKVQVSGQMAVVQIDGMLAKIIFDKNPGREFYIEESFPFDWLYPYLEPHGLIFKINHQPLPGLSDEIVGQDHDYWRSLVRPMIGDWLTDDTPVEQVAAFAKKTIGKQDFSGFTGDPRFIQNTYSHRMFSKLRCSIAGLYAWRLKQAADASEKERLAREADFAFRQAWALCPDSPEAIFRYVNLLMEQKRIADALIGGGNGGANAGESGQGWRANTRPG